MNNMSEQIKRIFHLIVVVVAFILCGVAFGSEKSMDNPNYNVVANISKGESIKIELTLENLSEQSLNFYSGSLSRSSIVLIVAKSSPYGGVLEGRSSFDDPSPGSFQIKPHGKYTDSINLSQIYPNLEAELRKRDLIVFWSVSLSTIENKIDHQRFGGYVLVKKENKQAEFD